MKLLSMVSIPLMLTLALTPLGDLLITPANAAPTPWLATWQASPQSTKTIDLNLVDKTLSQTLHKQTIRQVARLSKGGQRLRIELSNTYSDKPVLIGAATVARTLHDDKIDNKSLREIRFKGKKTAIIRPGITLLSDPINLSVPDLSQVSISLYFPETTPIVTLHLDAKQTAWIAPNNQVSKVSLEENETDIKEITSHIILSGIQVENKYASQAVAVLGDSITDGAGSSVDKNHRWTDFLATKLAARDVAVVNAGISGGCLLSDCVGTNALARLNRDVLTQPGVKSMIVMIGINDIFAPHMKHREHAPKPTLANITEGYKQLIEQAHAKGIRVIGATLTPFGDSLSDGEDYSPEEMLRQNVNNWIRHSNNFDAVIDLDKALRNPLDPTKLSNRFDSGDHIHPNDEGNKAMAKAVEIKTVLPNIDKQDNKGN